MAHSILNLAKCLPTAVAIALSLSLGVAETVGAVQFSFTRIGDTSTEIPGGTGNSSGNRTVFASASATSTQGLNPGNFGFPPGNFDAVFSSSGGTVEIVADRSTPVPGGGNFVFFGLPQADGNNTAFVGYLGPEQLDSPKAIFGNFGGSLRRLAPVLGFINSLDLSGENVVFSTLSGPTRSSSRTIEAVIDGVQTVIAQSSPLGMFSYVFNASIDGRNVAFDAGIGNFGGTPNITGIYTTLGGSLTKVIDSRDLLDGKVISSDGLRQSLFVQPPFVPQAPVPQAPVLRDRSIFFRARFTDGSSGLYRAQALTEPTPVPEASSVLGVFALGVLGVMSRTIKK